ncbi:transposase [Kitasatospora sp. SC0581]|uniref:transposase n=1 Tax=Kitasatospora sp. SC0581 TaxID=3394360 RepID=UPI003A8B6BF9
MLAANGPPTWPSLPTTGCPTFPPTPVEDVVRLAKIRWRIEHDYRELKTPLGLDHFDGRSWAGRHRHVTLVTATHLFVTLVRIRPEVPARA